MWKTLHTIVAVSAESYAHKTLINTRSDFEAIHLQTKRMESIQDDSLNHSNTENEFTDDDEETNTVPIDDSSAEDQDFSENHVTSRKRVCICICI